MKGKDWLLQTTALVDLRGQTSLIELAGASRLAKAVISVDAGPLHIAAAVGTPLAVVGNDADDVGASPLRLWQPRCSNVSRTVSTVSCTACAERRFRMTTVLWRGTLVLEGVQPEQVIDWLNTTLTVVVSATPQTRGVSRVHLGGAPSEAVMLWNRFHQLEQQQQQPDRCSRPAEFEIKGQFRLDQCCSTVAPVSG